MYYLWHSAKSYDSDAAIHLRLSSTQNLIVDMRTFIIAVGIVLLIATVWGKTGDQWKSRFIYQVRWLGNYEIIRPHGTYTTTSFTASVRSA